MASPQLELALRAPQQYEAYPKAAGAISAELADMPRGADCSCRVRTLGFVIVLCFACGSSGTAPSRPTAVVDGETIDLDLVDVELTDALATLASKASINLFAGPEVATERVSVSLHAVPWRDALARIAADHQLRIEKLDVRGVGRPTFWVSKQSSPGAPVTSFSGEQITARFDDVPIRQVTQALASVGHTQITVDDDVQETVTLHLRLPWDLALYHLAQKYDLTVVQENGALRISRHSR